MLVTSRMIATSAGFWSSVEPQYTTPWVPSAFASCPQMRLMFSPDLMPEIHCSTYDAYAALGPEFAGVEDPVIAGFR